MVAVIFTLVLKNKVIKYLTIISVKYNLIQKVPESVDWPKLAFPDTIDRLNHSND